jgi:hypothetical protein
MKEENVNVNLDSECVATLKQHVEWLEEEIIKSPDNIVRVRLADFAANCGGHIMKKVVDGNLLCHRQE